MIERESAEGEEWYVSQLSGELRKNLWVYDCRLKHLHHVQVQVLHFIQALGLAGRLQNLLGYTNPVFDNCHTTKQSTWLSAKEGRKLPDRPYSKAAYNNEFAHQHKAKKSGIVEYSKEAV
ncbi:hypothetical protein OROMI_027707 [Orobanche minor]